MPADTLAFSELFDAQYRRMLRTAYGLLRDEEAAEDVVQDAFLALFDAWARVEDPVGYLHRSVVNGARSRLRRKSVTQRLASMWFASEPSAEESALAADVAPPVMEALRELPRREREAVLYRYYLDLSEQQAADALGVRVGSVKGYASRGLKTLRASLAAAALVVLVVLGGWFVAHRLNSEPAPAPAGPPPVTATVPAVRTATTATTTPFPTPTFRTAAPTVTPTGRSR